MKVHAELNVLRASLQEWRQRGESIAFVPTMGNLHEGHLSLVSRARALADRVVVSIFVNPLQFGPNEDFSQYPRTLVEDLSQLATLDVDGIFTPSEAVLYPQGRENLTRVNVPGISAELCGLSRPGFFSGVATVVTKLLNVVQPDYALFGQKDYQQWLVICQLVQDLNLPIELVLGDTVRESDGLAMSSRNQYLTAAERHLAPVFTQALYSLKERIHGADQVEGLCGFAHSACQEARSFLESRGFNVDYLTVRNKKTLSNPCEFDAPKDLIALGAVWLGQTRLIDNVLFF
jgi:pantoate--beta-alanine ligase